MEEEIEKQVEKVHNELQEIIDKYPRISGINVYIDIFRRVKIEVTMEV